MLNERQKAFSDEILWYLVWEMVMQAARRAVVPVTRVAAIMGRLDDANLDQQKIVRYRAMLREGSEPPPVLIRNVNIRGFYVLRDGHHRTRAAQLEQRTSIKAVISGRPLPLTWVWRERRQPRPN